MSHYGANKVVPKYGVMGPVKATLEAAVRYMAHELGPGGIRVHALSPGPIKTRAASGLKDFDLLLNEAAQRVSGGAVMDIEDVGMAEGYLATPYAQRITESTVYVDAGLNLMAYSSAMEEEPGAEACDDLPADKGRTTIARGCIERSRDRRRPSPGHWAAA
jgi:enoyl-[acyl-carrier protein] reductase I